MPRARFNHPDEWQTAATSETGSGCLSFYSLSILSVFVITFLITLLGLNAPISTSSAAAPVSTSSLSPIFTREVQYWGRDITRWSKDKALDPNLVAVVMQIESCGDPRALSSAGAKGLFQVMPFHFLFGENAYDPETNAQRGLEYLARSLRTAQGNARLALAGYNGGIGVISRYEWLWSAETKRYVYYGAPIYADAASGKNSSTLLNEWYQKYGAGLCRQASARLGLTP